MSEDYSSILISADKALEISRQFYGLEGEVKSLPGELDFNFRISNESGDYILKVSRPEADVEFVDFQEKLLGYLEVNFPEILAPKIISNNEGKLSFSYADDQGTKRIVRMLSWIDGRLWSQVNPHNSNLLESLGNKAGKLTEALQDFDHPYAYREFDWDIAQVEWTREYLDLFEADNKEIVEYFLNEFDQLSPIYSALPKSIVHNDVNDNNIVVSNNLKSPEVVAAIDFGDAVATQTVNDLAITIAYAAMDKADPLEAACAVVRGYNKAYQLSDKELRSLYSLAAARLIISVTKSAINKKKEPDNKYLLISETAAWNLLKKWRAINPSLAYFSFRSACGLTACPNEENFYKLIQGFSASVKDLIPDAITKEIISPDLGVASRWIGTMADQDNVDLLTHKFKQLQKENKETTIAGGYGEVRSIYSTDAYRVESNNGPEYRTVHLGVDFWFPAGTELRAVVDGKVFSLVDNDRPKDYGVTLILEHTIDNLSFYTLYGHLGKSSMDLFNEGDQIEKGDTIGFLGDVHENGGWSPHLHFQVMLDMLGNSVDFPGVSTYRKQEIWKSICPDPSLLFNETIPLPEESETDLTEYRGNHLGKGLSLSYNEPLTILRGSGAWLIDHTGRKYLDTVNNVAHVGHEQPEVVKAGQEQMAVLNTNTRYLNKNINEFTAELLATFPEELSVVHFVNSGSEANELALRMAKTCTGQKDMIAMEVGYHGNTSGCIEVSSYKFDGKGGLGCPPYTHIIPLPDSYRGIYQGPDTGPKYASHVQEVIAKVGSEDRSIAGFICESIISCGGQIELPEGFLKLAYDAVHKAGGLCIADEVQVGCGRVGSEFWGFQLHGVTPDIVTIGKPIGNGHPLAAVVCTREVADAFANGMEYFNTFGGNPVSSVIGKTVLEVVHKENLQESALKTGNYLKEKLHLLQRKYPVIGHVRGQGLFLGFELNATDKTPLPEKASYLTNRMKERGILMSIDGPDHNVLKIKPPMVFSIENAKELLINLEIILGEDFMKS